MEEAYSILYGSKYSLDFSSSSSQQDTTKSPDGLSRSIRRNKHLTYGAVFGT